MVNMLQDLPGKGKTTFMWGGECAARHTISDACSDFERAEPDLAVDLLGQRIIVEKGEGASMSTNYYISYLTVLSLLRS